MKLLNAETMRKNLIGKVRNIRIYRGTASENKTSVQSNAAHTKTVKIVNEQWKNSAGREELLRQRKALEDKLKEQDRLRLENASVGYDAATIQALAGIYTLDLSRQADEYTDYTPVLYKEIVDENVPEIVNLRDMIPYVGKEETITGSGDTVPLMESALPVDYPVKQEIRGFGDKTSLRQIVFNPFHKTELIIESAARILADNKNHDSFGPIFSATYGTEHRQAADTTGATYDLKVYNTLRNGRRKAVNLHCAPLGKQNGLLGPETYLLVNPMDLMDIEPIVRGALAGVGGIQQIASALPFDGIIPYGGGINHGLTWGKETLNYPGVPQGKAYIFVKIDSFGGYRIVKRNETMDIGDGDVLGLTSEKRAWHRIRGLFHDFVLPKVEGGKAYGAVIEVDLPTFN
jgi:hypothetical protein